MNRTSMRTAMAGAALSLTLLVTGCMSNGIQSIPLPGGVNTGDNARTYKIQFDDVLDLVPQSMVKRDGIPVGRVTKVEVPNDQWFAQVTVEVQNNVDLSDEAEASVQQTSLLGEKFVSLTEPDGSADAPRQNPDQPIPVSRTRTATDIEQVLGALALLLLVRDTSGSYAVAGLVSGTYALSFGVLGPALARRAWSTCRGTEQRMSKSEV